MKFEGQPQFNSEEPTPETDKPKKEVGSAQEKILERMKLSPETNQIHTEKPLEEVERKTEQAKVAEEIEKIKEKLKNPDLSTDIENKHSSKPIVEKENAPQKIVTNRQEIKMVGRQLRELLHGDISIKNLSAFAEQLGIKHVIKTPLLRIAGANGLTQELGDGSAVILYHGILPGTDKYYLSHEIAHSLLGHLTVERKGIRQGLKEEWDADTFASSVTHLPQPLALLYCHIIDGFIGKLYKLVGPLIKKHEVKKISDVMGYYPEELKDAFK